MITGVGTDIIMVERVAAKISREQGFRELVFSPGEIAYCERSAHPYEHYAARFAAKEAFLKALGTGWLNGTSFNEIEIVHDANGKPLLQLLGDTAKTLEAFGIRNIQVSLSHQPQMAIAIVILE